MKGKVTLPLFNHQRLGPGLERPTHGRLVQRGLNVHSDLLVLKMSEIFRLGWTVSTTDLPQMVVRYYIYHQ
jgi:hypothetical protein